MHMVRPSLALDPRRFGQRYVLHAAAETAPQHMSDRKISDDLKLFATTFLGGFLFVTVLIA